MNLTQTVKESFISVLEQVGLAWWIEIITDKPRCVYYFGPFASAKEAEIRSSGYLEDLEQEKAQVVTITSKRCQPEELTIFKDEF